MRRKSFRHLLEQLPFSPQRRTEVLNILLATRPEHGMRAMVMRSFEHVLTKRAVPGEIQAWQDFRARITPFNDFSWLSIAETYLMFFRGVSLVYPELDIEIALAQACRDFLEVLGNNPLFKIMWLALDGNPMHFFKYMATSNALLNYGHIELEVVHPQHARLYHTEEYPDIAVWMTEAYFETLLKRFGHNANVTFTKLDNTSFQVDVLWG